MLERSLPFAQLGRVHGPESPRRSPFGGWLRGPFRPDTGLVSECCDPTGYKKTFGDKFAERIVRRYRRRGLNRTQRRVVEFLVQHGVADATLLEIGGGIGEMQIDLLRRGASHA